MFQRQGAGKYLAPPEPDDEALPLLLSTARVFVPITCTESDRTGLFGKGSWCGALLNGPGVTFSGVLGMLQVQMLVMPSPGAMGYLPRVAPAPHDVS